MITGHYDSSWWCSVPASRKQLRNGRKWSQVFSITDEFRSLGCSVEEWWGLWSQERTCLQNVRPVMVPKQAWLQQKRVSGQHGAVQRRARGCHGKEQPWSRPGECMSVLRTMLQHMEKFTSWSVEKKWGPVASWEVWQEQERMQGMWGGFVWVDSKSSPFKDKCHKVYLHILHTYWTVYPKNTLYSEIKYCVFLHNKMCVSVREQLVEMGSLSTIWVLLGLSGSRQAPLYVEPSCWPKYLYVTCWFVWDRSHYVPRLSWN